MSFQYSPPNDTDEVMVENQPLLIHGASTISTKGTIHVYIEPDITHTDLAGPPTGRFWGGGGEIGGMGTRGPLLHYQEIEIL